MHGVYRPSIEDIEAGFSKEVAPYGGVVWDRFCDGQRLYVRSVYPQIKEVMAGDQIQRGVALSVVEESVVVCPYLFRQIGQNGAILAGSLGARPLQRGRSRTTAAQAAALLDELRQLVHACSDEMILQNAIQHLRLSTEIEANVVLRLMPLLSTLPQHVVGDVLDRITVRFEAQRNRTLFELVSAVAAVAHETSDPATRWRLEELCGSLVARKRSQSHRTRARRVAASRR